jgi:hypothetical protein
MNIDPETIGATIGALVVGLGAGGKAVHMFINKAMNGNGKDGECPNPKCHDDMIQTNVEVKELKENVDSLFKYAKQNAENIQYIRGKIDQALG